MKPSKLAEHRFLTPLLTGVLSALLVLCTLLGGGPEEILGALPAILIVLALALGRYPGEDVIIRFASKWQRARPKAPAAIRQLRPSLAVCARGLALLIGSRSLRGPPAHPFVIVS